MDMEGKAAFVRHVTADGAVGRVSGPRVDSRTPRVVRLVALTRALVDAVDDSAAFTALTGARVDDVAEHVRLVAAQDEAHNARTGRPAEWGGFLAIDDGRRQVVGTGGYVRAPDSDGAVEIAYGTFPPYERQGYATATAAALIQRAIDSGEVGLLYAHTLPMANPSTRILVTHGFTHVGFADDEDAGTVWRWERRVDHR